MIAEFANVTLKNPLPDHSLPKGAKGTVVDALHADQGWVTVEFFKGDDSVAVLPVKIDNLAPDLSGAKHKSDANEPSTFAIEKGAR
jgi:hypothetical protein